MSARSMPGDTALIYPTETKEYPYEEPFKTAYKFLDRFLKTAEVAIVIGYSFRDRGITYIIDEAQSINPNLKFIIVATLIILAFIIYFFVEKKKKYFLIGAGIFLISGMLILGVNKFALDSKFSFYILLLLAISISGLVFIVFSFAKKIKYILLILVVLTGSIGFTYSVDYFFNNILEVHQQKRINVVLGIESDPLGSGYNVNQSKIAIGSGGLSGKGYLRGTQTKFNFVPEQSTDFIFCTVGEEWGFFGTTVLIFLFVFLLIRILMLAERQRTPFSRIYGYSVFSIFLFHFTINVGMTIGLVPVIGIPLPFISYGGSSLWAFTILLFIFLRLDASRSEFL